MAEKTWEEKMNEIDQGKSAAEVHRDPNPGIKFSLYGDESDEEEEEAPQQTKPKSKGKGKAKAAATTASTTDGRGNFTTGISEPWTANESLELLKTYLNSSGLTHEQVARKHSEGYWDDQNKRSTPSVRMEFSKQVGKRVGKGKSNRDDPELIRRTIEALEKKQKSEEQGGGDGDED